MKKSIIKKSIIIVTSIVLVVVIIAVGIKVLVPKELGLELEDRTRINYDVKSNKTKFRVNNVTLDFYYGHRYEIGINRPGSNPELIGFAMYFFDAEYLDKIKFYSYSDDINKQLIYEDYRNIDGLHLVKELSYDEFNSGDYLMTSKLLFGYNINHRESLTAPKEVFERKEGSFVFMITEVYYVEKDSGFKSGYSLAYDGAVFVDYKYINENTIRLSKPLGIYLPKS